MTCPQHSAWPEEGTTHSTARNTRLAELRRLYPDHYIAYRDEWDGTRLLEPFLLAVGANENGVRAALGTLSSEQSAEAVVRHLPARCVANVWSVWVIRDRDGNVSALKKTDL